MDNLINLINEILKDTSRGVKGYLKSRVIIFAITFLILAFGLTFIEAPMAIIIAFIISIVDILPLIGSGIVMVPWAIISYFEGNRDLSIGLIVLYVVLTISKQFIEPKILGDQIGIRPLYTFLASVIGSLVLGPLGLILGPLIAVVINSILKTKRAWKQIKKD